MTKRFSFQTLSISMLFMVAISSCTSQASSSYAPEGKHGKHKHDKGTETEAPAVAPTSSASAASAEGCDQSLWNHVYDPTRLTVLKQCMTVTGTVAESNVDDDGDQHFLVKLDAGQDQL